MNDGGVPSWVIELAKAGGVTLFALAVWYELRTQRIERIARDKADDERHDRNMQVIANNTQVLTVLVEHERFRSGPTRLPTLPGSST